MSTQSQASVGHNRNSSIGTNFRMRPVASLQGRDGGNSSGWGREGRGGNENSPPKQLSKVSPMVAGHAISRPRIQLTRMDVAALSAAREQLSLAEGDANNEVVNDVGNDLEEEIIEEEVNQERQEDYEQFEASPQHPGRSRFNLTNIGEESSMLEESRADESILEESGAGENDQLAPMGILEEDSQEEEILSPERSFRRQSRSSLHLGQPSNRRSVGTSGSQPGLSARQSLGGALVVQGGVQDRQSLSGVHVRQSVSGMPLHSEGRPSTSRQSLGQMSRREIATASPSPTSISQGRLSRPPLRVLSVPSTSPQARTLFVDNAVRSTSPQVDILKTQRHPAVVLSDLVAMNHPALPPQYSPHSTPMLPNPSPFNKRTSAPIIPVEDFPEDPSESFLEQMCDADPLEGPSWLFASVHKKKRRSGAVRKLSCVYSDSERASTMGSSGRATSSLDSSDIDISSDGGGASSREVSGYVLDRDLLETAVVNTPDVTLEATNLEPNPGKSVKSISSVMDESATAFVDDMELTRTIEVGEHSKALNSSDQENNPVQLARPEIIDESILSISVSQTPRNPLSSLTYTDPSGEVVKFNPRTDTGVSVAGLREAHILLSNVGMQSASPYKLSECYIDLSPGRSMSLDQLFSLGLRAGISSPLPKPGKRKHASEATFGMAGLATPPSKKARVTDLPNVRQKGVRASLDLIPPDLMAKRTSNLNMDRLPSIRVSNLPTTSDLIDSTAKINEVVTQSNTVSDHHENSVASSSLNDGNRKISVMPSFVLLEKSPIKAVKKMQDITMAQDNIPVGKAFQSCEPVATIVSPSIVAQGMTGVRKQSVVVSNLEIPIESDISNDRKEINVPEASIGTEAVVEPEVLLDPEVSAEPERSRRTKTRVDYAALIEGDENEKDKRNNKSDKLTVVKKSTKGKLSSKMKVSNSSPVELKETQETSKSVTGLETEMISEVVVDVLTNKKKSKASSRQSKAPKSVTPIEKETVAIVSDDEPETVSKQCQIEQVFDATSSKISRKSSQIANSVNIESEPIEELEEKTAESRGRSRRGGTAVSYKEPALGKKLRQVN